MRQMSWAFNTTQIPEALSKELFQVKQNYPDILTYSRHVHGARWSSQDPSSSGQQNRNLPITTKHIYNKLGTIILRLKGILKEDQTIVVDAVVSHIQRIGRQPEKNVRYET